MGSNGSATAYVYFGSSSGVGTTPITLTAAAGSYFGQSVASAGDLRGGDLRPHPVWTGSAGWRVIVRGLPAVL